VPFAALEAELLSVPAETWYLAHLQSWVEVLVEVPVQVSCGNSGEVLVPYRARSSRKTTFGGQSVSINESKYIIICFLWRTKVFMTAKSATATRIRVAMTCTIVWHAKIII
jgi:hypothetical protein